MSTITITRSRIRQKAGSVASHASAVTSPRPVLMMDYTLSVEAQCAAIDADIDRDHCELVVRISLSRRICLRPTAAPAINSTRGFVLFGPPGNGKNDDRSQSGPNASVKRF